MVWTKKKQIQIQIQIYTRIELKILFWRIHICDFTEVIYSQYSQYKSNLDRWKWYFPWYEDRTWKLENLYIKHKPPLKAIANVSQLIYKGKGILNFTVCLRRIWITVCYLAVFMNIQYWIWRRLSIFCHCIIQIISIFRTFTCISCLMNIFNRYMTLYVYWIYIYI